ncbi:DUF3017 domain-containing protein [Tessaracoccus sp. MC1865]|uniref:DUF3017 domain-containing protein n=1 Tax=Tessaracoccus sp. MC1865 TaxID=2760310 RepID=UPI0015FFAF78|nr:DUF3017 domain-containing protein [Tessaracoccus sp. MC1865]MBB1484575.1 DUF3017 domain-containing protein [Tessaracoccus sp. MC1865]QTO38336.1 DUF3017 domain-containing protein [Tessaracoccus sp. MC1865]
MIFGDRLEGRLKRRARDRPADSYPDSPWALSFTVAVLGVGVVFAALGRWRLASLVIGAALLLGAGLRLILPRMVAGLLVVRRRWIDVSVLAMLGAAVVALAFIVPPSAP